MEDSTTRDAKGKDDRGNIAKDPYGGDSGSVCVHTLSLVAYSVEAVAEL